MGMKFLRKHAVPLLFLVLCALGAYWSGLMPITLINEIIVRLSRNSFFVISLIIPILAGMGLNFGIVLGAMAAQAGYVVTVNLGFEGLTGILTTCIFAVPLAVLLGWMTGVLFNHAKGKEMITSIILSFFANGVYQFVFMILAGWIIPMRAANLLQVKTDGTPGIGLVNTVDLSQMKYGIDNILKWNISMQDIQSLTDFLGFSFQIPRTRPVSIPVGTFLLILGLCILMHFLFKTKQGQDFRSVGHDMGIAATSGIDVDRVRVSAIIFSTVFAAVGQVIFLQNLGNIQTYGSHVQVGTYAVASLLIGGASVKKATVGQALLGTLLFHTLFIVSPLAGKNLLNDVQIGEYFRVCISYGVICVALSLHAWQEKERIRAEKASA
ncbi:MAG: ABC transporter permease, partial [Synergistaceae bacterium]|nr:ABC transporter permease [Synergistaceae bacterium]